MLLTKKVVRFGALGSTATSTATFVLALSKAVNFHFEPKLVARTQLRQGMSKSEVFEMEVNSYVTEACDPSSFSSAFIFCIQNTMIRQ